MNSVDQGLSLIRERDNMKIMTENDSQEGGHVSPPKYSHCEREMDIFKRDKYPAVKGKENKTLKPLRHPRDLATKTFSDIPPLSHSSV
ncbi:hypothetical protein PM082_024951 [Marasmius tenuissimus]|nr:hypothetical protein PM082_024951 [Marasmius tenuissimus]